MNMRNKFTNVYAMKIDRMLSIHEMEKFFSYFDNHTIKKIRKFKFIEDSNRTFFARLLLQYVLYSDYHLKLSEYKIIIDKFGKPKLVLNSNKELFFNYSHSGKWIFCGVSQKKIGVDVEKISETEVELDLAYRFFQFEEYCNINNSDQMNKVKRFYDYWSSKESYMKWDGRGLGVSMSSFKVVFEDSSILVRKNEETYDCHIELHEIDKNYVFATCISQKCEIENVRVVNMSDFVHKDVLDDIR